MLPQQSVRHEEISIHALREEGDASRWPGGSVPQDFYPRPPRGGRPFRRRFTCSGREYFYPRPPRGGRRRSAQSGQRGGGDFYPRPPRGGRPCGHLPALPGFRFLSTPSARRATLSRTLSLTFTLYFYPRPPRGGRPIISSGADGAAIFLSTPSARRATPSVWAALPF